MDIPKRYALSLIEEFSDHTNAMTGEPGKVYVLFWLPGAWKSTLSKTIAASAGAIILSTDKIKDFYKKNDVSFPEISKLFSIRDWIFHTIRNEGMPIVLDSNVESLKNLNSVRQLVFGGHSREHVRPTLIICYADTHWSICLIRLITRFVSCKFRNSPVHFPSVWSFFKYRKNLVPYSEIQKYVSTETERVELRRYDSKQKLVHAQETGLANNGTS